MEVLGVVRRPSGSGRSPRRLRTLIRSWRRIWTMMWRPSLLHLHLRLRRLLLMTMSRWLREVF